MPSEPRRFAAIILEFETNDALAEFQRLANSRGDRICQEVEEILVGQLRLEGVKVHDETYYVKKHPFSPYIEDMTVSGLNLLTKGKRE